MPGETIRSGEPDEIVLHPETQVEIVVTPTENDSAEDRCAISLHGGANAGQSTGS